MKKSNFLKLTVPFLVTVTFAFASDQPNKVPEGMELIEVTEGYKVLVPKGSKIDQKGGQITVEDPDEYLMGRIPVMEKRIEKIEIDQVEVRKLMDIIKEEKSYELREFEQAIKKLDRTQDFLRKEIDYLKNMVNNLKRSYRLQSSTEN